jgi:hypothetical protein
VRTEELVSLLAARAEAVDSKAPIRRYVLAVGAAAAMSVTLTDLWLGVRATLLSDFAVPMFWAKEVFCAFLGVAGLVAVIRLARPGTPLGRVPAALAAPVAVMWLLAAAALYAADAGSRTALVFGLTSKVCPFAIAMISVPLFCAIFWSMRKMAPTRLRLAGAAGGFAAGALGALAYSLHCPELAAPFIGTWYVAGMLIPTTIGTLVGPYLLRW